MALDGSLQTDRGRATDLEQVPYGRERRPSRLRRFALRAKRNRLGLAALLPAAAMAAVFVAEPFAGIHTVDRPTPPPPGATSPAHPAATR